MGYVDLKCYFEKDTMDSNHVFFYDKQLICLFHGTGTTEKNFHTTTQREWQIGIQNNYRSLRDI